MNLAQIVTARATTQPDDVAIIDASGKHPVRTSFAQLDEAGACAATLLESLGLRKGDPVLLFQPMSTDLYVALLGMLRLGLVVMFLDPSAGRAHMEQCLAMRPPRALLAMRKAHLLRLRSRRLRQIPMAISIGGRLPGAVRWERYREMPPQSAMVDCDADAPALMTFTSGSTGQPKAAMRSHGFLATQHEVLERNLEVAESGTGLVSMPIVLLTSLASGVASLIPHADLRRPGSIDGASVVRQMDDHKVRWAIGSPAFFERVVLGCGSTGVQLDGVERLLTGGAPVFPRLMDALAQVAPNARVVAVYGSTEAEPIAHIELTEIGVPDRQRMSEGGGLLAGTPVPEIQLRVMRDRWGTPAGPWTAEQFAEQMMPAAEAGEVVVSGGHVLQGYVDGRGDVETKFRVAATVWHRTGDTGYLDAQGRVWLLGRCSARITDEHGTIHPFAVETAISDVPGVVRSALVAHRGRRLLVLELEPGKGAEVRRAVGDRLGWTKLDEIRVVPRVPVDRRHNAKIDYPALTAMLDRAASKP